MILLVEDEPDLLSLGSRFLQELGYHVVRASNGATALEIARHEARIDLLLTDVVMPGGMSGQQLAKELRRIRPDIPVLFVSGYSDEVSDAVDGSEDAPIVAKPYDRTRLAAAVSEALSTGVNA